MKDFITTYRLTDSEGVKHRIGIWYDEYAEDPRDWDNVTEIHTFHPRYKLGDDNKKMSACEFTEELLRSYGIRFGKNESAGELREKLSLIKDCVWYPVVIYDHSQVTVSYGDITQFPDWRWDASDIGFVYVTRQMLETKTGRTDITDENWKDIAEEYIKAEIKMLDQWSLGECYGYTDYEIQDDDEEVEIDSCAGYMGDYEDIIKDIYPDATDIEEV